MKKNNFIFLSLIITLLFSFQTLATDYVSGDKVFIEGFDPVSYQTKNKAVLGLTKFTHEYDGIKIQFSSEENKKLFIKSPDQYMPAYKGWCAFAMAKNGQLVEVNPKTFKIINGKTYLFYNKFFINTLKKWNKENTASQVKSADSYWNQKYK